MLTETGEIDVAAMHEMAKELTFIYEAYSDSTCLVELDEEPPHPLNKEALAAVLQAALMLDAKIVDEIQVMRKTVVDGSNTSGFQRTALVARNGFLATSEGVIAIPIICIEEEAAKIIEKKESYAKYRLDRLGIPLVEIGTSPDIKSPKQCLEAAEKIGMILRSTGKVKRGLGTIRQDVNVSIKDGARIEIKGAQELKQLPKLVENEVMRQLSLLEIKKELLKRNAAVNDEITNVTDIFKETASKIIKNSLAKKGVIYAIKLDAFSGLIGKEIQPGRRLGTEFSDYAKVRSGVRGIFHSDELPNYGITEEEVKELFGSLIMKMNDAFVLVADEQKKAEKALEAVIERAKLALLGIPKEVRKANDDATSSFLRPMPGAARMYPETDVVNVKPDISNITIPELISDKIEKYEKKLGLGKDLAALTAKSDKVELFESFVDKFPNIKPAFIAETILSTTKEIKRRFNLDVDRITDNDFEVVLGNLNHNKISKEAIPDILLDIAKGERAENAIRKYRIMSDEELEREIKAIVDENKGVPMNALVGRVMDKLRGKADGKKIVEILKRVA